MERFTSGKAGFGRSCSAVKAFHCNSSKAAESHAGGKFAPREAAQSKLPCVGITSELRSLPQQVQLEKVGGWENIKKNWQLLSVQNLASASQACPCWFGRGQEPRSKRVAFAVVCLLVSTHAALSKCFQLVLLMVGEARRSFRPVCPSSSHFRMP